MCQKIIKQAFNPKNTKSNLTPFSKDKRHALGIKLPGEGKESAAEAAARAEAERQATISANVGRINSAYAGRENQYADFIDALRKTYGTELTRQQTDASRQLKFGLARGGLTGGSQAVFAGQNLAREANQGTLTAESKAQGALADLRAKDEQSRLSMISLAQSGADIGDAATQTANALRANIGAAQSSNLASGLGEVFGGTAATYKAMQEAAALRRGLKSSELYASPFTRGSGATGAGLGGTF